MKNIFSDALEDDLTELGYLRYLFESNFPVLLAENFKRLHGQTPSRVEVEISYIDKSPIVAPNRNSGKFWGEDQFDENVELGDLLFTLKVIELDTKLNLDGTTTLNEVGDYGNNAFIFQFKKNSQSKGKSTRKQEYLYRKWPDFRIHTPKAIAIDCRPVIQIMNKVGNRKKSGIWLIESSNKPSPEIIILDSCAAEKETLTLDQFLKGFHSKEYGKDVWGTGEDWDKLINSILLYNRKKLFRRNVIESAAIKKSARQTMLLHNYLLKDSIFLNEHKVNDSFFLKKISYKKLKRRRFWIVEVKIFQLDSEEFYKLKKTNKKS